MGEESKQQWLSRNRPPRVQITYDVHIGDAIEMKELPLVVGILADLAGNGPREEEDALPPVRDRKFVEIDRDNFDEVMTSLAPRVLLSGVPDRLAETNGEGETPTTSFSLQFDKLEDFHPAQMVQQVDSLRQLYEARQRLVDLSAKLDGNDQLNGLLQQVVENTETQDEILKAAEPEEKES